VRGCCAGSCGWGRSTAARRDRRPAVRPQHASPGAAAWPRGAQRTCDGRRAWAHAGARSSCRAAARRARRVQRRPRRRPRGGGRGGARARQRRPIRRALQSPAVVPAGLAAAGAGRDRASGARVLWGSRGRVCGRKTRQSVAGGAGQRSGRNGRGARGLGFVCGGAAARRRARAGAACERAAARPCLHGAARRVRASPPRPSRPRHQPRNNRSAAPPRGARALTGV
jgi:hypothetical protein